MNMRRRTSAALLGLTLATVATAASARPRSISRIEFGPPGTLFIADWKAASVHAIRLDPASGRAPRPFNLMRLLPAIARAVGTADFQVEDLKARPGDDRVYLAVSRGDGAPAVVAVGSDGSVRPVGLDREAAAPIELRDAPVGNVTFWARIPERSLTVTDMRWHGGRLYVAGLSNQAFSSTLRIIDPGRRSQTTTSVAIYHTTHDEVETRAPIRAMAFLTLGGTDYLVAAYMCTPLVAIPVASLEDGRHVTGKTIAELGYGNTPVGMVAFSSADGSGRQTPYLAVANVERNAETIPVASIAAAILRPGITTPIPWGQISGVDAVQSPMAGVVAFDNLDGGSFAVLRRNARTGDLQLVSVQNTTKLRVSDFVSERIFPSYAYAPGKPTDVVKPAEERQALTEGFASPTGEGPKRD